MQSPQTQAILANIIWLGRIIGAAIIVIGILFSLWDVADYPDGYGGDDKFRIFVEQSLQYLGLGAGVILLAEIADRLGKARA
jgi:hypothetical protein